MAGMKLIPGYRFHPTDVELVMYFLKRKVLGKKFPFDVIAELDIYKHPPWDLPAHSLLRNGDLEWYFFCPRGKKYGSGARMNRATEGGYWKTTGKDRPIEHKKHVVGLIKTLVFHRGKAPKGERTDWVMHEFQLKHNDLSDKGIAQDTYVICKVFQKEGPGPRNGAQYGKPFDEEEWDAEEEMDCVESVPIAALSVPVPIQPITCRSAVVNDMHPSTIECFGLTSVSCPSGSMPPSSTHPSAQSNQAVDDTENVDTPAPTNNAEDVPYFDPNEIFENLGDLGSMAELGEDGHGVSCGQEGDYTATNGMLSTGEDLWPDYLELIDLEAPLWQTEEHGSWSQNKQG